MLRLTLPIVAIGLTSLPMSAEASETETSPEMLGEVRVLDRPVATPTESPFDPANVAPIHVDFGDPAPAVPQPAPAVAGPMGPAGASPAAHVDPPRHAVPEPPRDEDLDLPTPEESEDDTSVAVEEVAFGPRAPTAGIDRDVEPIDHSGFVMDLAAGGGGCVGALCRAMNGKPGMGLRGFMGFNVGGRVEVGGTVGWSSISTSLEPGTNWLSLFGVSGAAAVPVAEMTDIDMNTFVVDSARTTTGRGGLAMRMHLLRTGRVAAWAGAGVGYRMFRNNFSGERAAVVRFHGIDIPVEAGLAVHVHRNVALGVDGNFAWTHYLAVDVKGGGQSFAAPMGSLDGMLTEKSNSDAIAPSLPSFWGANATVRVTF